MYYYFYIFQTTQGAKSKLAPSVTEEYTVKKWLVLAVVFEGLTLGYLYHHLLSPRMATSLVDHKLNKKAQKEDRKEESIGREVSLLC